MGRGRCTSRKTGVPEEITFKTKPEIALDQIRWACEAGLPGNMVLMDAGYGHDSKLRRASLSSASAMWPAFSRRLWCGHAHAAGPCTEEGALRCGQCNLVKEVALRLRAKTWHTIRWREGTMNGILAVCTCARERCIQPRTREKPARSGC